MRLSQFDKLKTTSEELIQKYRKLKYQIVKLEKENNDLREKVELISNSDHAINPEKVASLKHENERLFEKNQKAKKQLENLISRLEQQ